MNESNSEEQQQREDHRLRLHFAELRALGEGNYSNLCVIAGKVCGLGRYMFTTGILVGMTTDTPYERRYCYEQARDAFDALLAWDGTGHPGGPWIKVKGQMNGRWLDELGPGATQ